jgi:hypothetical protein
MGTQQKSRLFLAALAVSAVGFAEFHFQKQSERHPAGLFQLENEIPSEAASSIQKDLELKYGVGIGLKSPLNILKTQNGMILFHLKDKKAVFVSEKKLQAEQIEFASVAKSENIQKAKELSLEEYFKKLDERVLAIKYSNPALYASNLNRRVELLKNQIQSEFLRDLEKEKAAAAAEEAETSPSIDPVPVPVDKTFHERSVLPPPVHILNK